MAALRKGLAANRVADRCTIYEGDNATTAPALAGLCDRVSLGLIPSSELSWPLAAAALRRAPARPGGAAGGWMHVHANVNESEIPEWVERLVAAMKKLLDEGAGGLTWAVRCPHLEKVKWYAPRVRHVVADIEARPVEVSA